MTDAVLASTGPMIVAVGGSDPQSVLRAARMLVPSFPSGVLAVSVCEPLSINALAGDLGLMPLHFEEERRGALSTRLRKQADECAGTSGPWRTSVIDGYAPHTLSELARALRSPLIVMGIGRHRPLDRILGVETTLRTIQRAPCPVLAVHKNFDAPFREVVLATDFSPASAWALEVVAPLLREDATLHLLHAWEPAAHEHRRLQASDEAYAEALPDRFRRFGGLLSSPRAVTVTPATREGKAAERILDFAQAHDANLIVAGRHGFSALKRLLVGSVTTAILRGADRSVLVCPEPRFADTDRLRLALTGTSGSNDPAVWAVQLARFIDRNRGRRTVVEVEDLAYGAHVLESGYVLLDAAYDPHDRHVALTLGDSDHAARRVTRSIGTVDSVTVTSDSSGRDMGVRIGHGGGQTILTFPGE